MQGNTKKASKMRLFFVAEGEGFEPPETCASTVFKTAAFDRSAIPPASCIIYENYPFNASAPETISDNSVVIAA